MDTYLDTVGGLPMHALVVHAAVVLVPIAAIGAMLMAFIPAFSRRFGIVFVVFAALGAGASLLAKESGEVFAARVGLPQEHADYGTLMPIVAAILFGAMVVLWAVDRGIPMNRSRTAWPNVLAVVVVLVALFALFWTVRTGHTGEQASWTAIIEKTTPGNG